MGKECLARVGTIFDRSRQAGLFSDPYADDIGRFNIGQRAPELRPAKKLRSAFCLSLVFIFLPLLFGKDTLLLPLSSGGVFLFLLFRANPYMEGDHSDRVICPSLWRIVAQQGAIDGQKRF